MRIQIFFGDCNENVNLIVVSAKVMVSVLQQVVRKHLGDSIPAVHDISKNVSFILQNGHPVVSYPRPLLPNVAEIACIHCKPASPLPSVCCEFFYSNISLYFENF